MLFTIQCHEAPSLAVNINAFLLRHTNKKRGASPVTRSTV